MSNKDIFENPAFSSLSQEKRKMITEMLDLMENRTPDQKLQILMAYGIKMRDEGLLLSMSESKALMEVLKSDMSKKDKQSVDQMISSIEEE